MTDAQQFELNEGDQIILLIDVSASMQINDAPNNAKRIDSIKEAATALARSAEKFDKDGIDILTFGEKVTAYEGVSGDKIDSIIGGLKANESTTRTHLAIQEAYKIHKKKASKQTICLIVTDGVPESETAVYDAVRSIASELQDEHEFAICFLQIGQDTAAANFLVNIDDNLNAKYDIVDCQKLAETTLEQAVMGALHD
jgi:uncharacterized protein with von Willebrand factor type A (vWA) domain